MTEELQILMKILDNAGSVGLHAYIAYMVFTCVKSLITVGIPALTIYKIIKGIFRD